jgi:biotin-(acetyl-CoA carboxylase) ligase
MDALLGELAMSGFSGMLERYKARSCTLGQRITVTEGERRDSGAAVGFDELGFLMLQTDAGETLRLSSGNVTLRE